MANVKNAAPSNEQRRDMTVRPRLTPITLKIQDGETMPQFIERARQQVISELDSLLTVAIEYRNIRQRTEAKICHAHGIGATKEEQAAAREELGDKLVDADTLKPIIYDPKGSAWARTKVDKPAKAKKVNVDAKAKPSAKEAKTVKAKVPVGAKAASDNEADIQRITKASQKAREQKA